MTQEGFKRKLTAILSADAVGYSRLMGEDEAATVQTITSYRNVISTLIKQHDGTVIDSPGDNLLAEFASVVDAVQCAVAVQKEIKARNDNQPENRKMHFRIGINLGDVIQEENRIYGDGVNIAARIESLADGGGICITRTVYDQVKNKLKLGYEYRGAHSLKNIEEPVRVYRVLMEPGAAGKLIGEEKLMPIQKKAHTLKICIAVLPFENLFDHRGEDYFSRGFVEDLITDLAHFQSLQVISSYSSRKIGAESHSAIGAARELAVDYLLKGNLRHKSEQVRITVQLLDSSDGRIVWAERYDAPMDTIFEIQDDIVERVVGAISTNIDKALLAVARKKPLTSLAAYDCWLRGMDQMRCGTPEADLEARRILKKALEIDPNYSRAYAGLSLSHFNTWSCQLWEQYEETAHRAYDYALEASRLDETDHVVQMILGRILVYRHQYDLAEVHLDKSLALNSNDADSLAHIAMAKTMLGKAAEGEQLFLKALRLDPYRNVWYPCGAYTYFFQRQYDTAIETALKGPLTEIWVDLPAYLAAAYAYTGHQQEAEHYLDIFIDEFTKKISSGHRPQPREVIDWLKRANPFKHDDDTKLMVQGILLAGLDGRRDEKQSTVPATDPRRMPASDPN
ncbi:MAG: adenylate/guanylate cyclase domain-containing protein [Nitrospinales bacterium]